MPVEIKDLIDRSLKERDFIEKASQILHRKGFYPSNSIVGVSLCRDELCQSALVSIKSLWQKVFNFSSLGGLYISGVTGIKAFLSHSPLIDEQRRAVVFLFTHIGIDRNLRVGFCHRAGIENSTACGALYSLLSELENKNLSYREDDYEQNFLRSRISREFDEDRVPHLFELTELALKIAQADIERAMNRVLESEKINYAIVSGIQIHHGEENLILPKEGILLINGQREIVNLT